MKSGLVAGLLVTACWLLLPAEARPTQGGLASGVPQGCIYPVDNGCSTSDPSANFIDANFGTDAIQNGQTSNLSQHLMPFNAAGWQSRVGYNTTSPLLDPVLNNPDTVHCHLTGATPNVMACNGSANPTWDHFNLCDNSTGSPINYEVINETGTITLTNINVCDISPGTTAFLIDGAGGTPLIMKGIYSDSRGLSDTVINDNRDTSTLNTVDLENSAFINNGLQVIGGNRGCGSRTFKNIYVYGLGEAYPTAAKHAEFDLYAMSGCSFAYNTTTWNLDYEDIVGVIPATTPFGVDVSAFWWLNTGNSSTNPSISAQNTKIINSILVTNQGIGGSNNTGFGIVSQYASMGNYEIGGLWIEGNGLNAGCANNGGQTNSWTAGVVGSVFTVTAGSGQPIAVGEQVYLSGFTTDTIASLGTGTGGNGTYNLANSHTTVVSTAGWKIVPGMTNGGNFHDNYSLNDTVPVALTFPLPDMTAGAVCPKQT